MAVLPCAPLWNRYVLTQAKHHTRVPPAAAQPSPGLPCSSPGHQCPYGEACCCDHDTMECGPTLTLACSSSSTSQMAWTSSSSQPTYCASPCGRINTLFNYNFSRISILFNSIYFPAPPPVSSVPMGRRSAAVGSVPPSPSLAPTPQEPTSGKPSHPVLIQLVVFVLPSLTSPPPVSPAPPPVSSVPMGRRSAVGSVPPSPSPAATPQG